MIKMLVGLTVVAAALLMFATLVAVAVYEATQGNFAPVVLLVATVMFAVCLGGKR